jgi:hypothetical protein
MGTDCQNQPEAHLLLQAFRALARLAAPGLVLEAEAIVGPGLHQPRCVHSTSGDPVVGADRVELPAWGFAWLTGT